MDLYTRVSQLFGVESFQPHGYCLVWSEPLLLTYIISDGLIALSYYSIPFALGVFVYRRRDLAFKRVFLMFGLFILACGTTHVMDIWKLWVPSYWTDAVIRQATAVLSFATAVVLWPLLPKALALPSPKLLSEKNAQLRHEIAERKRAEAKIEAYARELEQRNRELREFAYVASHDLKEPLRTVSGYLQLIERRYQPLLDDAGREFIAFAVGGAERMNRLITDLLDYSRVGSSELDFEEVDSTEVIAEVTRNLAKAISEHDAVIETGPLPQLRGSRTHLIQLFQNLIANALKFRGEQPPHIRIEAGTETGTETGTDADMVHFTVRDNGIGIPPEFSERIFAIFQRLNGPEEYQGTGIGLAVCRRIAERHGGRIWVESDGENGTTFHVLLASVPLREKRRSSPALPSPAPALG